MDPDERRANHLQPPGAWNPGSLYEHFSTRLQDQDKRHNEFDRRVSSLFDDLQAQLDRRITTQERERRDTERHLLSEIAGVRREFEQFRTYVEKRLNDLNKLREQSLADRGMFVTKDALDGKLEAMYARLDKAERDLDRRWGGEQSERQRVQSVQPVQLAFAGFVVTALVTAAVIVSNVLTTG